MTTLIEQPQTTDVSFPVADREKLLGVAAAIRAIAIPEVSEEAKALAEIVRTGRDRAASIIEGAINNALGERDG